MKRALVIAFLCCTSGAGAQFNYFVYNARRVLSTADSVFLPDKVAPAKNTQVDTYTDSVTTLKTLLDYALLEQARTHDSLRCSSILVQLSGLTLKRYSGLDGASASRWTTVRRQLHRSFLGSTCGFGMISAYAFNIPLVKTQGDFYYDKHGPDGGYNLYDGKRKPKKKDGEEAKVTPLKPYTEEELLDLIRQHMRKSRCSSEMNKHLCSFYGYAVAIDEKTLHSGNNVPQARVVVLLGSRRMKFVRPRPVPAE